MDTKLKNRRKLGLFLAAVTILGAAFFMIYNYHTIYRKAVSEAQKTYTTSLSDREYLESFLMQAVNAEKYLLWRKELDWPSWNRMEESVKEHLDIAEAIFRGDSDAACKAMELHFIFHWEHVAKDIVE